ncbi:MAG: hypothetical protein B7X39_17400 [Lysobacterales bacterium 14-68-21]|jgi:hypothetical protein|nr:MAG: hypothetical protein B7X45_15915 [Xanthomonadales bacterium 15-68-25]OZB64011.1 MAG: hypothetical protein B7X39_17400 [Xanthomonadales bacterium 14-68-21]
MDELLAKATQGVDLTAPGAFWHVFANLMALVPWAALTWWTLFFVAVGAALGWWRGRTGAGVVWALLLGPIGWWVVWRLPPPSRGRAPPPLPPRRSPR